MAVMQDKVLINSVDVTYYRITWNKEEEWQTSVDALEMNLQAAVKNVLDITVGMSVVITRGFTTDTDEKVFIGQITQVLPRVDQITIVAKGEMIEAIKAARVKSWDLNVDSEAGVGSEIFKSLCANSGLDYDSDTIISTGTDTADLIEKFVQNDEDDFDRMNRLADLYSYTIIYNYDLEKVEFKPKGYVIYGKSLTVGPDITTQIRWKENMEQMCNKAKILGATVYDKINPAVFAGPSTTFTLLKTPEDTEVRQTNAAGALYIRGQKGVGTIGTDYDYYVDTDLKSVVFSGDKTNIWIRYGAQVPIPVIVSNQTSINKYGGPDKTPHFKKFSFSDLKNATDAEDKGRAIILKYSTPFIEASSLPINNDVIQTYGNIKPGYLVNIIDPFTQKDVTVFVKGVEKSFPHLFDKITVGDEIWRTEDWQADQMKKINDILNTLNKNQDILISAKDLDREIKHERRYALRYKYKIFDSFILGHYINSLLGQGIILDNFDSSNPGNWSVNAGGTIANDAVTVRVNTGSLKLTWTGPDTYDITRTGASFGDLSSYTGASSGAPTKGTIGIWLYSDEPLTAITLFIGSGASDFYEYVGREYRTVSGYTDFANLTFDKYDGWNYYLFDLDDPEDTTGTPDWTDTDYCIISIPVISTGILYLDYLTISKSNFIGLNGLGYRGLVVGNPKIIQGDMTYKEHAYDSTFHDSVNSTATFSTVTNDISFTSGQVWYSEAIDVGSLLTHITVTLGTVVGTIKIEISSDNKDSWQEVTDGLRVAVVSSDKTGTFIRLTENNTTTATIDLTKDDFDQITDAVVQCKMEGGI